MDNHTYNLIQILAEKGEGLDVYKRYEKDMMACKECTELLKRLEEEDKKDIEELKQVVISHVKSGAIT